MSTTAERNRAKRALRPSVEPPSSKRDTPARTVTDDLAMFEALLFDAAGAANEATMLFLEQMVPEAQRLGFAADLADMIEDMREEGADIAAVTAAVGKTVREACCIECCHDC